ncbi:hypothetical protein FACS1894142_6000 [Spirochaetia bacterium]|nr:hypothetical protein FACS1894142_6000 [Spirochaetia bacterium]
MKLSEKLKKQIDEARDIVEKSNAEAQSLADADDVDPAKAIVAIEKAQGKAKAAELVISKLEPKLAAALKEEAREIFNQKQVEAEKAVRKYIADLSGPYKQLREAVDSIEDALKKLWDARKKITSEIIPMYEDRWLGYGPGEILTMIPNFTNVNFNEAGFNLMRKRIDESLKQKQDSGFIEALKSRWEKFEKPEPPEPYKEPERDHTVFYPHVRDQSETPAQIRERLGLSAAEIDNRSMGGTVAYSN